MPTIHLDVPESLVESLDTERELLGFESREAYLRWVVDHRTDIEVGSDREQVLSAFTERVEELEAKLDDADEAAVLDGEALTTGTESEESREPVHEPRTARIQDDSVNELATELSGVENERLNAFARSAVRQTGETFDGAPKAASITNYRPTSTTASAPAKRSPTSTPSRCRATTGR